MAVPDEAEFLRNIINEDFFSDVDFNSLQYQGFDPLILLQNLRARAAKGAVSDADHGKNLAWLSALGTMRGTNLDKIAAKSSDSTKSKLLALKGLYLLVKKPVKGEDASLGRIAACFAMQLSYSAHKSGNLRSPVSPGDLPKDFPAGLAVTSAGSLIPKRNSWKSADNYSDFVQAFLYHQYLFDKVINPSERRATPVKNLKDYVAIQIGSKLYNEDERVKHWVGLGVLANARGNLVFASTAIAGAVQAAAQRMREISSPDN